MDDFVFTWAVEAVASKVLRLGFCSIICLYFFRCIRRHDKLPTLPTLPMLDKPYRGDTFSRSEDFDDGLEQGIPSPVPSSAALTKPGADNQVPDLVPSGSCDCHSDVAENYSDAQTSVPKRGQNHSTFLKTQETIEKDSYIFPYFGMSIPQSEVVTLAQDGYWKRIAKIRADLTKHVRTKLQRLEDSKLFPELMKRQHAAALYLALGMRTEFVQSKFLFDRAVEAELGSPGKTSALDSLYYLIGNINVTNPFGQPVHEPTDGRIVETAKRKNNGILYDGTPVVEEVELWKKLKIKYAGLKVKKNGVECNLRESIETAESLLPRDDLFMLGTTGSTLEQILWRDQGLLPSENFRGGRHDLGPGVYCYKGRLRWALSFAFDRC
ncbi:expressed unknown protein [Seminavis robusta]|uniref:Uncharacterized protein n=1 Tax=Seminavis robusta TaxID=568900 RepID=A0A9N8EE62_9STRA|nr:expressed unknown protein [Seminavis robusta]|eukprot:Sro810_g205670.1 n/a (381) ;mRNA; f:2647-3789